MADIELKRCGLGGSDAGAIFGVHPWRDQYSVYLEKMGLLPPPEPSMRMRLGKLLEQPIAQLFQEETGYEVRWHDRTTVHPVCKWLVTTADAFILGRPVRAGLDCKLVGWDQRRKWQDEVPQYIVVQAWTYMAAYDCDEWHIAALIGDELRVYVIRRDAAVEKALLARLEEWWTRYILGSEEPPLGGSAATTEWLQAAYPNHGPVRPATRDEIALLEQYAEVRNEIALLKPAKDTLENQLRRACADVEAITWEHGRFSWKKTKDTEFVNWEAIARSLIAAGGLQDSDNVKKLIGAFTAVRPGSRRIRFDCDQSEAEADAA